MGLTLKHLVILLVSVLATLSASAEENPFVGTWKTNPGKSDNTGRTITYTKTPTGFHFEAASGDAVDFAIDGKYYTDANGFQSAWVSEGDNKWVRTERINGHKTYIEHIALSADDKEMIVDWSASDGKDKGHIVRTRVAGSSGLPGTWKTTANESNPETMTISVPRPGVLRIVSDTTVVEGPTDGKPFSMTGPNLPKGWMGTLRMTGPRSLEWSGGLKAKAVGFGITTVSADGMTITEVSWSVGKEAEKFTQVYEKQ